MMIEELRGKTKTVFGRYNCAQSVAILAGREDMTESLRQSGAGRAPGGSCGALHAAVLLTDVQHHDKLKQQFVAISGAESCQEIKAIHHTPCHECVAQATRLLLQFQKG